ncbi:hypothetical protein [Streptomyces scopuliridis]|uniref:Uncharacterized protein n=1 Tax=Streptomyces scopuliridis RB72 TaxID=1440053 RepID=A0A2T7T679_9ACTN|nr:hypothetical protein [Streptomyces scopuliridis]PVE10680.1 hypothetical protein Y717_26185 [Streptomyces scopuliridis RB72]
MPEFHRSGGEDPLSAALKHAADRGGRQVLPLPVEEIEARGTRRRRTTLALAAACAVCVLSGASAVAALNLTSEQPPARPVPSVTPSQSASPSNPLPTRSQFASPSRLTTSVEVSTGSPGGGVPSGTPSITPSLTVPPSGAGISMPSAE